MTHILKRALPFILAFAFGVMISAVIGRISPVRHNKLWDHRPPRCNRKSKTVDANDVRRIMIDSVPNADFPDGVRRNGPTGGSVRLIAMFDADGSIKSIRPYPMVPFGVAESAAGSGEFAGVTPFMSGSRFVNSLPFGLTELAIEQVSRIKYKPKIQNGKPASQRVIVLTDYSYTDSRFSVGCSSIDVTIMDDTGILWRGNTWVSRNVGCSMI